MTPKVKVKMLHDKTVYVFRIDGPVKEYLNNEGEWILMDELGEIVAINEKLEKDPPGTPQNGNNGNPNGGQNNNRNKNS